jgi:toxin ParE1/3/4
VKLVWSAFALSDRDGIFTHIEANNPTAAIMVGDRIVAAARRFQDFPGSGRPGRIAGYASWSFPIPLISPPTQ